MKEKNILIAFILNIVFSIIEFIGGAITNSVAIMSDAIHDLGDATSIGISYVLERKSKKKPDKNFTYGYLRYSVLGAFITSSILFAGSALVIVESIKRLINPVDNVNYKGMIIFAVIGVIINSLAAYVTRDKDSLNQKSVNLHMLEDVLGWVVVLIGSVIMNFVNAKFIDSLMSIGVAIFILINVLSNIKDILNVFLEKMPNNISIEEIEEHIKEVKGVIDIHHIHIWTLDGNSNYATLHVVTKKYDEKIKLEIKEELEEHGIAHSTIEFELEDEKCNEEKCEVKLNTEAHHHHHH